MGEGEREGANLTCCSKLMVCLLILSNEQINFQISKQKLSKFMEVCTSECDPCFLILIIHELLVLLVNSTEVVREGGMEVWGEGGREGVYGECVHVNVILV